MVARATRRIAEAVFTITVLIAPVPCAAEIPPELVIGVPRFSEKENLVSSREIGAELIRNAVADPILRERSGARKGLFSLVLVDSFQVDAALEVWSYRLREALVFSNGQPIRASDICNSLLACHRKDPSRSPLFENCVTRATSNEIATREWVDVKFRSEGEAANRQQMLVSFLSQCPIFEKRTRDIFGEDFGSGVNLLGSGEYRLTSFQPGKEYWLERVQRDPMGLAAPQQIVGIRSFTSSRDALTALRVGNILLFYNSDPETAENAAQDETLRIGNCLGNQVIYRRELHFDCTSGIKLTAVTTDFPK